MLVRVSGWHTAAPWCEIDQSGQSLDAAWRRTSRVDSDATYAVATRYVAGIAVLVTGPGLATAIAITRELN